MAETKIDSSGVTFPDATVQATAAETATKEFFVPVRKGLGGVTEGEHGDFYVWKLDNATEYLNFNFKVPHDFTTLTHVKVIGIKDVNGTIDWTVTTDFAAIGEAYNAHSDTDTADGLAMVNNEIEEVDISDAFTGLAADDFVGVEFVLDAISASYYGVIGLVVKYT